MVCFKEAASNNASSVVTGTSSSNLLLSRIRNPIVSFDVRCSSLSVDMYKNVCTFLCSRGKS